MPLIPLTSGGVSIILLPVFATYAGFIGLSMVRGVGTAAVLSQRASIASDAVGVSSTTDAIGILIFANSMGSIAGNFFGGTCDMLCNND